MTTIDSKINLNNSFNNNSISGEYIINTNNTNPICVNSISPSASSVVSSSYKYTTIGSEYNNSIELGYWDIIFFDRFDEIYRINTYTTIPYNIGDTLFIKENFYIINNIIYIMEKRETHIFLNLVDNNKIVNEEYNVNIYEDQPYASIFFRKFMDNFKYLEDKSFVKNIIAHNYYTSYQLFLPKLYYNKEIEILRFEGYNISNSKSYKRNHIYEKISERFIIKFVFDNDGSKDCMDDIHKYACKLHKKICRSKKCSWNRELFSDKIWKTVEHRRYLEKAQELLKIYTVDDINNFLDII